jgi:hypothetical protein
VYSPSNPLSLHRCASILNNQQYLAEKIAAKARSGITMAFSNKT